MAEDKPPRQQNLGDALAATRKPPEPDRPVRRSAVPRVASTARSVAPRDYDPRETADASAAKEQREWLPARDALALVAAVYEHPNHAKEAIIVEAAAGRIATRAESAEVEFSSGRGVKAIGELTALFWREYRDALSHRDREDWRAGTFVYHVRQELHEQRWTRAFGVEFAEADLRSVFGIAKPLSEAEQRAKNLAGWGAVVEAFRPAIERMAAVAQAPPAAPETGRRNATNAEVDAWYAALSPEDQARSVRWLHVAANAALAPRRVVRTQVEPFGKNRPTGPRRKR